MKPVWIDGQEIIHLAKILVAAGKFATNSSAQRAIRQGAVKIQVAKSEPFVVSTETGAHARAK